MRMPVTASWERERPECASLRSLTLPARPPAVIGAGAFRSRWCRSGRLPQSSTTSKPASSRGAIRRHRLGGRGLTQFGLLLLIATPVARVAFSVAGFFRERDYVYVGLTLVVLAVLLHSLFCAELR
jgi:hypothetical protein